MFCIESVAEGAVWTRTGLRVGLDGVVVRWRHLGSVLVGSLKFCLLKMKLECIFQLLQAVDKETADNGETYCNVQKMLV